MNSNIQSYILTAASERALKPLDSFRECSSSKYCPEMIVIPAGSFIMGSPASEIGRQPDEGPQHRVTITRPFAASKFDLTFDQWDACVAYGACEAVSDAAWGRGERPVIFVTWDGAQQYLAWLSKITGKRYRLLTELEYEYATRAGVLTAFPWGDEIGRNRANCDGCGSEFDDRQTAPVGSFAANGLVLYDTVGNVFKWTEDCYHDNYSGAPTDGSAWTTGDCSRRVARGGSWISNPVALRSAARGWGTIANRNSNLGFRVGRTLGP